MGGVKGFFGFEIHDFGIFPIFFGNYFYGKFLFVTMTIRSGIVYCGKMIQYWPKGWQHYTRVSCV